MIEKVKKIINSCNTHKQLMSCVTFYDSKRFTNDELIEILTTIKSKSNEIIKQSTGNLVDELRDMAIAEVWELEPELRGIRG